MLFVNYHIHFKYKLNEALQYRLRKMSSKWSAFVYQNGYQMVAGCTHFDAQWCCSGTGVTIIVSKFKLIS